MSNSGLNKALKAIGVSNVQTKVGDRFVFEKMQEDNLVLGGEQSGHIIIKKYATTGDGVLTAIMIVEQMLETKSNLSKLVAPVKLLPQKTRNVRVTSKAAAVNDPEVQAKYKEISDEIGEEGRILLRESGTEPVIRIMVEYPTVEGCEDYIEKLFVVLKKRGLICE